MVGTGLTIGRKSRCDVAATNGPLTRYRCEFCNQHIEDYKEIECGECRRIGCSGCMNVPNIHLALCPVCNTRRAMKEVTHAR